MAPSSAEARSEARTDLRPDGRSPLPGEVGLLALLCVGVLVYWAFQYHPFVLPNNDYYSFASQAEQLGRFEPPLHYKRMPIFPALMGWLAPVLPGPHSILNAALVWNQAFSIGSLVLLFVFARRSIGAGAILLPTLVATTPQFHAMGLQPLVEPSLGFFVVAAFVAFQRSSGWQWVFAFLAALSRYEAAMLIPALFLAGGWRDGGWRPKFLAAVAAGSGVTIWLGLGMLAGSGGSSYLDLMEGMGFQPAPGFFLRSLSEPFGGWFSDRPVFWLPFAGAVLLPIAAGIREGFATRRFETAALLGFAGLCATTIVFFGIDKARYVYPTQWIWIHLWVVGALALGRQTATWLRARPTPLAWAAAGLGLALAAAGVVVFAGRMAEEPSAVPRALEAAWLGFALALTGGFLALAVRAGARDAAAVAVACGLGLAMTPIHAGGVLGKQIAGHKIQHTNRSAWRLAHWLAANRHVDDVVLVLPRTHILHLTSIPEDALLRFANFEAESLEELHPRLVERGVTLVAYTDRGAPQNPAQGHYYRLHHVALAEWFADGDPLPGFELVATLALPDELEERPVQVYRVTPLLAGAGAGG